MAIEIKQGLRLAQQLVVTPQLQQAIKLLQMTQIELSALIQKELIENPLLEEDADPNAEEEKNKSTAEKHEQAKDEDRGHEHVSDEVGDKDGLNKEPADFDWENYINLYNSSEIREERERPDERPSYENFITKSEGLHEHLLWQLKMNEFTDEQRIVGAEIIGNINEDGYLIATIEEISSKLKKEVKMVNETLDHIQNFDPAGIAARDLEECLLLQIKQIDHDQKYLEVFVKKHMKDLEFHDFEKIANSLNIPRSKVEELAHTISMLEPKPGRPYANENPQYIVPDVFVSKIGDKYVVTLNDEGLPKLKISGFYRKAMTSGSSTKKEAKEYIHERMRAAMWLIRSIHQRQRTLRRVSNSIVKFQNDFFDHGLPKLKPLVLREVADDIGMHESTISRVTTNKYMHTPHGIFELKYFFNAGLSTAVGDGVATEVVRQKIKNLVDAEDNSHPLSDQKIAKVLKEKNINIARRTVAKYRESLGIPPSSQRRRRS